MTQNVFQQNPDDLRRLVNSNPTLKKQLLAITAAVRTAATQSPPRREDVADLLAGQATVVRQAERLSAPWAEAVACKATCWWCCTKPVEVDAVEVLYLLAVIETWDDEERTRVLARALNYRKRWKSAHGPQQLRVTLACPLLEDERCMAHARRPLACIGYNSIDYEQCVAGYESKWREGGTTDHRAEPMIAVHHLMLEVRAAGLRHGIPLSTYALGPALAIGLSEERVPERWASGEDVFAEARWWKPGT